VARKTPGQLDPGHGEGLVEGAAARILGQHDRAAAELGRDAGRQGPVLGDHEDVHEGIVVTVQVEHQIGVDGLAGKRLAQGVQLRERRHLGDRFAQGGADRRHVGVFRIRQLARELLGGGGS
jgi:hypothetical protein